MKTLFILLITISCGKNINRTERNFIVREPLKAKVNEVLPSTLVFKTDGHQVNLSSRSKISYDFFESTNQLLHYYSYELSHIHPDAVYQLNTPLPEDCELYIYDQGQNHLIDPQNLKFSDKFLERLNQQKSFFYLAFNKSSQRNQQVVIKNLSDNKTIILLSSLEDYLQETSLQPKVLNTYDILTAAGDNHPQWWIKKDSFNQAKLIYASLNDIKDEFQKIYKYQKHTLKRIGGQGKSLLISDVVFLKVSAKRTMQKAHHRQFSQTFYTLQGELPYNCYFTESHALPLESTFLNVQEMQDLFVNKDLKSMPHNSWSELGQLKIELPDFNAEHFEVGLIARKCPTSRGPKINKQRVSTEKELELVIESYVRKE